MLPISTESPLFSARVVVDGMRYHLLVLQDGITLGIRPGKGRLLTWPEISRLADGPPLDRHGVVLNGRLAKVFDDEAEAHDWASGQRSAGAVASVIRVPVSIPS